MEPFNRWLLTDISKSGHLANVHLMEKLCNLLRSNDNEEANMSSLILCAYEIGRSNYIYEFLLQILGNGEVTNRLWKYIWFLGRLRVAFTTFTQIRFQVPGFAKVKIIPIPLMRATS